MSCKFHFLFIVFLCLFHQGTGQELPPVINFTAEQYGADNQNWMLSQSEDGHIFAANNKGLLEFNGANWDLYPSPNESIIRSVNAVGDKIYTGCYMNFGYWKRNPKGTLDYTSLSDSLGIKILEDEQFWNIVSQNKWLLFQSLNRILILDKETYQINAIETAKTITKIFKMGDEIYFQVYGEGLYTIDNGEKLLLDDSSLAKNNRLISLFKIDTQLTFISEKDGFFKLIDSRLQKWNSPVDDLLSGLNIYSGLQTRDRSIILGSIANGVYHLTKDVVFQFNLDQTHGLGNNTVLSLFEDRDSDIWLGLDNGIDCININAPLQTYFDPKGRIGTTYASVVHKDYLYLGTNQGLFYKRFDDPSDFELIEGTAGQVWNLKVIDEELFCGHNSGTFVVNEDKAQLISQVQGAWDLRKSSKIPGVLVQGNYDGFYTLEKRNGNWQIRSKIKGFDISSRNFELTRDNRIIVNHEYKGVFELELDSLMTRALSVKRLESVEKGSNSSLVKYGDMIYYASKSGFFHYDSDQQEFSRDDQLSEIFENDEYISGKLVADENQQLWAFTKSYIIVISREKLGGSFHVDKIAIPHLLRNDMKGFENIAIYDKDRYIIGTANGYMLIEPENKVAKEFYISINHIISSSFSGDNSLITLDEKGNFKSNENNLIFEFSVPQFEKYSIVEYQYKLNNGDTDWSPWSQVSKIEIKNLLHDTYQFQVRAKINNVMTANIATYDFVVNKPWYLSSQALGLFALLIILLFLGIHWFYKRYYRNQRARILEKTTNELKLKELASQKEIIQLKNEGLNQEIEARNRELAISTMNMIRKNTTLNNIKGGLKKFKDSSELEPVIDLIDKSINNKEDWEFFEEAFNHADKDFFKKVKELHPELTSNDLRLCVYLRLNLSSKEIAPLLNISPRSVEIKRYRLRKKINLGREYSLNNYFIDL